MKKVKSILSVLLAVLMVFSCVAAASAAELTEKEDNSTTATATSMDFASKINGDLSSVTDLDYFKLVPKVSGLVTVKISHSAVAGSDDTAVLFNVNVVKIVDKAEKAVASFTSASNGSGASSTAFAVEEGGEYYVKVTAGNVYYEDIAYSLNATINSDVNTETEPNNIRGNATALALSTSGNAKHYYGTITKDDVDYYSITLPSAGVVYLYLYNDAVDPGEYKATLCKVDDGANGQLVDTEIASIAISKNESSKTSVGIGLNGGQYLVKVTGVSDSTGSYRTRVYYSNVSNAEYEINNSANNANLIKVGSKLQASVYDENDVDYFKFTAPKTNYGYTVTVGAEASAAKVNGQWLVKIMNSNSENVVKETVVTNKEAVKLETENLDAGTYYIVVEGGSPLNNGIYEVSVASKAKPEDGGDDEEEKTLWERIQALDWGAFMENFNGWFEQINIKGIVSSISSSVIKVITYLVSMG